MASLGHPIVYFGNDWNADNRTSSHHVAEQLARKDTVLYVEAGGVRTPKANSHDTTRMVRKLIKGLKGIREVEPNLHVVSLLQVPFHRNRQINRLNRLLAERTIRPFLGRQREPRPILWFMNPRLHELVGRMGEILSVYYCVDDWSSLPGVDRDAVRRMDEEATRKADIVFATASSLVEEKLKLNPNSHLSPHGVDFELFAEPSGETPKALSGIARPIIGYYGLMESWMDMALVERIARSHPEWSLVLIGRVAVPTERFAGLPNVHFLGHVPYQVLPSYARCFDVGIIPFRVNQLIHHCNPKKLPEYLASGFPVVSVRIPETEKFKDVVLLAENHDEFVAQIERAREMRGPEEAARRRESVRGLAGTSRGDDLRRLVGETLRGKASGRNSPAQQRTGSRKSWPRFREAEHER